MSKIPLTVIDPETDRLKANTPYGMAHWAGTGPAGKTCRECESYGFVGYYADGPKGASLKPASCKLFSSLMGRNGPPLSHDTPSCKYFKQNPEPKSAYTLKKDTM